MAASAALSGGAIAGIVIALLTLLVFLGCFLCWCRRRKPPPSNNIVLATSTTADAPREAVPAEPSEASSVEVPVGRAPSNPSVPVGRKASSKTPMGMAIEMEGGAPPPGYAGAGPPGYAGGCRGQPANAMMVDTTGDGLVNAMAVDTTGDGRVDTVLPGAAGVLPACYPGAGVPGPACGYPAAAGPPVPQYPAAAGPPGYPAAGPAPSYPSYPATVVPGLPAGIPAKEPEGLGLPTKV